MNVGNYIRKQRKKKGLLIRELASSLQMDQSILSKIERGERRATEAQIECISNYFDVKRDELMILWLSDKVISDLRNKEFLTNEVFKVSEERIVYEKNKKHF